MISRPRKKATKKQRKPMKLTKAQLKKIKGGWEVLYAHPLCDASPKGSAHDCGSSSISN